MREIQISQHFPEPDYAGLDPVAAQRVQMTVSCRDTDPIAKVGGAGAITTIDGRSVQVMHNGLLIDEGCYYGPWMTQIIRGLGGHHEPQEEVVFDTIVRHLQRTDSDRPDGDSPVIVELGSFWAYYSMWFCRSFPTAIALDMEPDPAYLEVGRRNAELNGLADRIRFLPGVVGPNPGQRMDFRAESSGELVVATQHDLASVMALGMVSRVDLAMIDIQGAETILLDRARDLFVTGAIRFLVVSTHHQSISGDPLTHQRVLELLMGCGAHIIAEHSVRESFSGDGLIAATFDTAARELTVAISHARAKESLFGEPEYEINHFVHELGTCTARAEGADHRLAQLESELAALRKDLRDSRAEVDRMRMTKLWRWSSLPRAGYARLRRRAR